MALFPALGIAGKVFKGARGFFRSRRRERRKTRTAERSARRLSEQAEQSAVAQSILGGFSGGGGGFNPSGFSPVAPKAVGIEPVIENTDDGVYGLQAVNANNSERVDNSGASFTGLRSMMMGKMPVWVLPVAIGGVLILMVFLFLRRKK